MLITPSNLSVIEIAPHSRVKLLQRNSPSFRKTTTQERMLQYYKHIQAKYSGRTSLEPLCEPERRAISAFSIRSLSRNDGDFRHMMNSPTPKRPTQRIGNFSYPIKAWQNPKSNSGNTSATIHKNVSEDHYHHSNIMPEASVGPIHHGKFTGNSLPKWNQLYRAYQASPK